jgi:hypothetical protein
MVVSLSPLSLLHQRMEEIESPSMRDPAGNVLCEDFSLLVRPIGPVTCVGPCTPRPRTVADALPPSHSVLFFPTPHIFLQVTKCYAELEAAWPKSPSSRKTLLANKVGAMAPSLCSHAKQRGNFSLVYALQ